MSDIPRQPRDFPIGPFAKAAERWFDELGPDAARPHRVTHRRLTRD